MSELLGGVWCSGWITILRWELLSKRLSWLKIELNGIVEDQWLRKSGLCLGSWSTVEMMLNVTFSSSILLPEFSRCNIRELRQRWSGNLVRSEGVVDYRPLEMVLANKERRHGVSIVYLSNRTTGEWIWTSEKWIVDQSGDYAEVMIGSGIML